MTKEEMKALVAKVINGQGNQVPGEDLATLLNAIIDKLPNPTA